MSRALAAGVGVALAAAALVVFFVLPSGRHTLTGPPGNPFRLSYPGGWRVTLRPPAGAVVALVRADGHGSLQIARDEPVRKLDGAELRLEVQHDFSERLADFSLLSAGMEQSSAGPIFVYAYLAPGSKAVHTVALVPAGNHSYDLTAVSRASLRSQIDGIIRSFRPS